MTLVVLVDDPRYGAAVENFLSTLGDLTHQEAVAGKVYGWVHEKLGFRTIQGVRRYWYSLDLIDESGDWSFGDFGDHQFEPTRPPSWGPAAKAAYSS